MKGGLNEAITQIVRTRGVTGEAGQAAALELIERLYGFRDGLQAEELRREVNAPAEDSDSDDAMEQ